MFRHGSQCKLEKSSHSEPKHQELEIGDAAHPETPEPCVKQFDYAGN
jgi:hypothetical protein